MNDPSTGNPKDQEPDKNHTINDRELEKLKLLLFKQEKEQLQFLLDHLKNPKLHANDIAKDLPLAIILHSKYNNELKTALTPLIEDIIKSSFKKNVKSFADALYPVIGPAIRKAISESFKNLIQSINKTLEHSFSLTGIKWRIEAVKTGKSFAEIVLAHTLIYQVEQVFLIHKKNGILLRHVMNNTSVVQDADLVSGMLNAIQSFVKDSFSVTGSETLNLLEVGDLTVWIEQSPDLILAAVIRGIVPKELGIIFQNTLEEIQLLKSKYLDTFNGDTTPFIDTEEQLNNCLRYKLKEQKSPKKSIQFIIWIFILALISIMGLLFTSHIHEKNTWTKYLKKLQNTPGIVITSIEKDNGRYNISGLRDPLSINPFKILNTKDIDSSNIIFNFKPYISTHPKFLIERLTKLTKPPKTVKFKINNGTIFCYGSAHHSWISAARNRINELLFPIEYNDNNLIDMENEEFTRIMQNINTQYISFEENMIRYSIKEKNKLNIIAADIKRLVRLADTLNKKIQIKLFAHSDHIGPAKVNLRFNAVRVNNVFKALKIRGIKDEILIKSFSEQENKNISQNKGRRCVHFAVIIQ